MDHEHLESEVEVPMASDWNGWVLSNDKDLSIADMMRCDQSHGPPGKNNDPNIARDERTKSFFELPVNRCER
jgi:hypothetical protein